MIIYSFLVYLFIYRTCASPDHATKPAYYSWCNKPERLKSPVLTFPTILGLVVGSIAKREYCAAYKAVRQIIWLSLVAAALGHQRPNNTKATCGQHNSSKARSKVIVMRFYWL